MGELAPWHWVIVAVVFLVLFGSRKLPDAARSLGRSLHIFKSEAGDLTSGTSDGEAPPGAQAPEGRSGPAAPKAPASAPADPGPSG
ncbi:Sec-independent protein translocase subunit TatA [Actinomadura scrupuli]|uniref:Sec-independent protein translocase subunit TatA n=1 Tax=Actinomadura scrupuli TaxID=559629 RepID=UPI003D974667